MKADIVLIQQEKKDVTDSGWNIGYGRVGEITAGQEMTEFANVLDDVQEGDVDSTNESSMRCGQFLGGDADGCELRIVTGQGLHSDGGLAIIKPAVEQLLEKLGVRCIS